MMTIRRTLAICAVAVLATACAFAPVDRPVSAPQAKAWQVKSKDVPAMLDAAKTAFESAGYGTASITPDLGELKSKPRALAVPEFCDCGTWNGSAVGSMAQSELIATYRVQPNEEGTLQASHVCAAALLGRNLYGMMTRREAYACAIRRQIETDLNQRIETILRARNIPFN